jgi:arabinofuranosyltransferase
MSAEPEASTHAAAMQPTAPAPWRGAAALLCAAVVALFAIMVWQRRWIGDDGFINLRVVHNLLAGYGPVFNPGERVEAGTSALWIMVLGVAGLTGIRLEDLAVGLGMVCSVGAMALLALPRGTADPAAPRWPLGLMLYASLSVAWDYGTSGLETPLSMLWLALCWRTMTSVTAIADGAADSPPPLRTGALLLGLGPMVRPDLALFSAAFWLVLLGCLARPAPHRLRRIAGLLALSAALPVATQLFRMGYFAALVPNTAYAKEAFGSNWSQGLRYFGNFAPRYQLVAGLLMLAGPLAWSLQGLALRRHLHTLALHIAAVGAGLASMLYIVRLGGDFMHGRMFLHGLFGLLLPVACLALPLHSTSARPFALTALTGTVALALAVGILVRVPRENEHGIGDERGWFARESGVAHPFRLEHYEAFTFHQSGARILAELAARCPDPRDSGCQRTLWMDEEEEPIRPRRMSRPLGGATDLHPDIRIVVPRIPIGIIGTLGGPAVHLVDRVGLSDAVASRLILTHRSRPGHEKRLHDAWIIARYTDPTPDEDPRVAAARRALGCGDLLRLREATAAPLTLRRFVANLRLAFRLHRFRFPADPLDAAEVLCDGRIFWQDQAGGSGGSQVRARCPGDTVLVGLRAAEHADPRALTAIQPVCRALDGTLTDGAHHGTLRQDATRVVCPDESRAVGLEVGVDGLVVAVTLLCGDGGRAFTRAGTVGQGGTLRTLRCPPGLVMTSLVGRAGALVDALGGRCEAP